MQIGPAVPTRSSPPPAITVVIVDGDPLARRALRARLAVEDDIKIAGEAPDASTAVDLVRSQRPDVALIEFVPPDQIGGQAIVEILTEYPQTMVVLLALEADEDAQIWALRAGAAGWLLKSIDLEVLPRVLRGVWAGEAAVTRALGTRLLEEVIRIGSAGLNRLRPVRSSLTQREWEVADLLVEGAAITEIAGQLQVSPATVRTHVKHILRKLGMHSRDEAIRYVEHLRRASGA